MPPGTTDQIVEIPLPVKGMATDVQPSRIPAGYSPLIHNYIPGEPGQMRMRRRVTPTATGRSRLTTGSRYTYTQSPTSTATFTSAASNGLDQTRMVPVGMAQYGDNMIIAFTDYSVSSVATPMQGELFNTTGLGSWTTRSRILLFNQSDGTVKDFYLSSDSDSNSATFFQASAPPIWWGNAVQFNGRIYGTSNGFYGAKHGLYSYGNLWCWGGTGMPSSAPSAAVPTAINFKIANGATSGSSTLTTTQLANLALFCPGILLVPDPSDSLISPGSQEMTYFYKIVRIDSAGQIIYIDQPYGRGADTSIVPDETASTLTNFTAKVFYQAFSGPYGAAALNVFQGRLFAFRGAKFSANNATYLDNIVQWSYPGNGDNWPTDNYTLVDDAVGDMLTGAVTVGENQLVFTRNSTLIWSGYDEDSFNVDTLTRSTGCIDHRSITTVDDRAFWVGENGVWSWSGSGLPRRESHPNSAVGVSNYLKPQLKRASEANDKRRWRSIVSANVKGRMITTMQTVLRDTPTQPMLFHPSTGVWSVWGIGTTAAKTGGSTDFTIPFYFYTTTDGRSYAVGSHQIWEVTDTWDAPRATSDANEPSSVSGVDQYYNTSDVLTDVNLVGTIQFPDLIIRPGQAVRIKELAVNHASLADVSNGTAANAFDIYMGTDNDPRTSTAIKTVPARLSSTTTERKDYGIYHTDRVTSFGAGATGLEGTVLRFTIDKPNTSGYECKISNTIYSLYAKLSVVREFRIDPTAT